MQRPVQPLQLDARRDFGEILGVAWQAWRTAFASFFVLTLAVVAPFWLLIDGVWAGTLTEFAPENAPLGASIAWGVADALVIPPLVTAIHVTVVLRLAEGERPGVGAAAVQALRAVPHAALAVALYVVGVGVGLLLLVVPGIYLSVRWYFAAQAAVAEDRRGTAAIRRSHELVAGMWWRTLGILLLTGIVGGVVGALAGAAIGLPVGLATDAGAGTAVAQVLGNTLALSYTALAATLLFFDLRARREPAFLPPVAS